MVIFALTIGCSNNETVSKEVNEYNVDPKLLSVKDDGLSMTIRDMKDCGNSQIYYKDPRTNLYFSAVVSTTTYGNVVSIAPVPADSLKNVKVFILEP